jgi:FlaA1/EpsC-like NDP-sugar epimerase
MALPEAAGLILTAASMGIGGETFVLDMGEPVNIAYMAWQLANIRSISRCQACEESSVPQPTMSGDGWYHDFRGGLCKCHAKPDIRIEFTGLRPGEKLTEQLYTGDHAATIHPRIWTVKNDSHYPGFPGDFTSLTDAVDACDERRVMRWLRLMVPEYKQSHMTEANTRA